MSMPITDQSSFNQFQENLQSPPLDPNKKPSRFTKKHKIAVGVGGLLFMLLILLAAIAPKPAPVPEPEIPVVVVPPIVSTNTSEFSKRLIELQAQLVAADPAEVEVLPPPVALEISL